MRKICLTLFFPFILLAGKAQIITCSNYCILDISLDTMPGTMNVTIYNGDSVHINYPMVLVIDSNGDTVGNPNGNFNFFSQLSGTTLVHQIPTTLDSLPAGFTATVILNQGFDSACIFSYPMNCFQGQPNPDCNDITVTELELYPAFSSLRVVLFNSCLNCLSGINGPVYCEMALIRTVAPFDTLVSSDCFCLSTPENNNSEIYVLPTNLQTLPPLDELRVSFFCGSGLCDSLTMNIPAGVLEPGTDDGFKLYPNPATDILNLNDEKNLVRKLELYDSSGRLLMEVLPPFKFINVSTLPTGIYFVALIIQGERRMKKLVINN